MSFPQTKRSKLPRFIDGRRIRSWRAGPPFPVQIHDEAHGRFVTAVDGDRISWRRFNKDGEKGACTRSRWKRWLPEVPAGRKRRRVRLA